MSKVEANRRHHYDVIYLLASEEVAVRPLHIIGDAEATEMNIHTQLLLTNIVYKSKPSSYRFAVVKGSEAVLKLL